ncbi:ABC transporter [Microbacterium sp. Root180]|nr:ABC transporter [Microbacterium sp. Root180]
MPNDIDPEEPDRHEGASVVALPSSPDAPAPAKAPARKPAARAASARGATARTAARKKPAPDAVPKAAPAPPAPVEPEPPLTEAESAPLSDLETAERAAVDLVIPPKPPLPEDAPPAPAEGAEPPPPVSEDVEVAREEAAAPTPTETEIVPATPDAEPEPEREPASETEAASEIELEPAPTPPAAEPEDVIAVPAVLTAPAASGDVLVLRGVSKRFGDTHAVDGIDLTVPAGTFYGLVGPNGAGKTTTLSMIAGLLEPDRGSISVGGVDAASDPVGAKRLMGVLPDRLRTFDRLTGRQLLYYYGVLRGLAPAVVESRTADLARAFDLTDALGRVVSDYSAGMAKKVMLAGALIHSPRVLVLDEPFEAVDPVSSAIILDILSTYVAHGGTVILSSHGMELVERVCTRVAVIVAGQVLAEGTVDEVRGELSLEQRFIELAGGLSDVEGLEWLHTFSD